MTKVEIYTSMWCPFCYRAKQLLKKKGVEFTEIDVDGGPAVRAAMRDRAAGRHTVPQIFIDDVGVGGCDELYALEAQGKLDALLASPA
ncbi:MAG: glutaredoxin 3 [Alphaproteobacteria bacterium]|nr:glutaredoxin 3 [Alphaproteobacteria bacterium]MCB9928446.1 glutaredoxin 3 [Alphaproteobacteria bacterium]